MDGTNLFLERVVFLQFEYFCLHNGIFSTFSQIFNLNIASFNNFSRYRFEQSKKKYLVSTNVQILSTREKSQAIILGKGRNCADTV